MDGKPKRRTRRTIETGDFLTMLARLLRAGGNRVGVSDVGELTSLVALRDELDEAIVLAVIGLRQHGVTWDEIGKATGTTRQAAIQKWSVRAKA